MNKLLNLPLKKTLLVIGIAFIFYVLLSYIVNYLLRLEFTWHPSKLQQSHMSLMVHLARMIVGDLHLLSRYLLEISTILLLAQGVWRLVQKLKSRKNTPKLD